MNVYDFDKTVFYPDSSYTFFLYCLKRYPGAVLRTGGDILRVWPRYLRRAASTKELKEKLFAFLRFVPEPEKLIKAFWDEHISGVGAWYLAQKRPDDLIISASPEFLVREAADRLGVSLLATRMDLHSGRIEGENCHDEEKLRRFREAFPDGVIDEFYSDSLSDAPLARIAGRAWLVKKETRSPWPPIGPGGAETR